MSKLQLYLKRPYSLIAAALCQIFLAYCALIAFVNYAWYNGDNHVVAILLLLTCWIVSLVMRAKDPTLKRIIILILADGFMLYHGAIGLGYHRFFYKNSGFHFKWSLALVIASTLLILADWVCRLRISRTK